MLKRFLLSIALLMSVAILPAYALSDAEYLQMKKNAAFAKADKNLTQAYKNAREEMSKNDFAELQKAQRKWISNGRDKRAKALMKQGYSRLKAYTQATQERADEIMSMYLGVDTEEDEEEEEIKPVKKPARKNEVANEDDDEIILNGTFVNVDDEDFSISFEIASRTTDFYSIKIYAIQDMLTESGTLEGDKIKIEEGDHEIEIKVLNSDTLEVKTNKEFKNDNGYSIDGRYERVEAVG